MTTGATNGFNADSLTGSPSDNDADKTTDPVLLFAHDPRPLLLLDVDGPLNPYRQITRNGYLPPKTPRGETPYAYNKHLLRPRGWETEPKPLPVLISPEMGHDLRSLAEVFHLVWATTWEGEANRYLAPLLGLPSLPVITWAGGVESAQAWARQVPRHRGSWKVRWIAEWVDTHARYRTTDGRLAHLPWVWVDDETNRFDRDYLHAHYGINSKSDEPYPFWNLRIEASHGLRRHNIDNLRQWATSHQPPATSHEPGPPVAPRRAPERGQQND